MHRQCPVSYNNSYAYGLTSRYIITVIIDMPVSLCTYVLVMDVHSYLVGSHLRTYLYLLGLLTYVLVCTGNYLDLHSLW